MSRNGAEPRLPGLNYTPRQLFWVRSKTLDGIHHPNLITIVFLKVSAANVWCAKYRPKALKLRVLTGVHSPDQFRVQESLQKAKNNLLFLPSLTWVFQLQGPFSNMEDFSRDFNCPVGSNMNPPQENKCQVEKLLLFWFRKTYPLPQVWWTTWRSRKGVQTQSEKNPSSRISNFPPDQTTSSLIFVSIFALWRHESFYNVFME